MFGCSTFYTVFCRYSVIRTSFGPGPLTYCCCCCYLKSLSFRACCILIEHTKQLEYNQRLHNSHLNNSYTKLVWFSWTVTKTTILHMDNKHKHHLTYSQVNYHQRSCLLVCLFDSLTWLPLLVAEYYIIIMPSP